MKLIHRILKFISLNAFMAAVILLLVERETEAVILLVIALAGFALKAFLQFYKFCLLLGLKKTKSKNN
jgi:hypothetical protein